MKLFPYSTEFSPKIINSQEMEFQCGCKVDYDYIVIGACREHSRQINTCLALYEDESQRRNKYYCGCYYCIIIGND